MTNGTKAKVTISLETLDGDVFFTSGPVTEAKWRDIQKCLNGNKAFVILPGEDGFERIYPQCVLESVIVKKSIALK